MNFRLSFCSLFVLPIALWSAAAMSAPPATQVSTFHLDAPLEQVMPLFTALGERSWAAGWDPVILSGREERGTAFVTRAPNGRETTWIVVDYRPAEGRASYARLAQGSNIGLVDVICTNAPKGGTDVSVRYTLTGLTDEGRAFVSEFVDKENYTRMIEEGWRDAITASLRAKQQR